MKCRDQCGMCCIAPSISSFIPGMPSGKPANTPCVNLDIATFRCQIWGSDQYPNVCHAFIPHNDVCGNTRNEAETLIQIMEIDTCP